MYSISKLMWIKKHEPKVCAAAKRVHLIEDFVVWHLTRRAQIDYSLAARTMAFDIHTLTWSEEIFDAAGIDLSMMSKPVPTGTSAGTVTPQPPSGRDCIKTALLFPSPTIRWPPLWAQGLSMEAWPWTRGNGGVPDAGL